MNGIDSEARDDRGEDRWAAPEARRREKRRERVWQAAVFVIVVGLWEILARLHVLDEFFFSRPFLIAQRIGEWVVQGTSQGPLWQHFVVTFEETVISFAVGVVFGIAAGYALGRHPLLSAVCGPYIYMLNALPRVVLAPIFILWLGLGMASKVALGVTLTFFIVFFNAFQGVREVDANVMNNARILGADQRQLALHVIVPSALTWIISSLHTSFGFALVGAVVGEFMGATEGLGYLIAASQGAFDTTGVFAGMLLLSLTALVADGLVTWVERRLVAWRRPNKEEALP